MTRYKTNLNRIVLVAAIIAVAIVGNACTAVTMAQSATPPANQQALLDAQLGEQKKRLDADHATKLAEQKVQIEDALKAAHDADLKTKLAEQKVQLDADHAAKLADQKVQIEDALKAAHDADLKTKLAEQKVQLEEALMATYEAELKTKLAQQKAQLEESHNAKLADQKNQIEAPFKTAHDAEIKRLNDAHSSALKKLEDEKSALTTKVADLSRENGSLSSSHDNLKIQFAALNTTHNDFKENMVDRLESIRKEREATLLDIAEVRGLIGTLQTQLQAMNDIAAGFKAKNEAQTAEAKRIDNLVKEYKAAEIAQLAKMQELQTKLKEIETNYQDNINKNKGRSRNA